MPQRKTSQQKHLSGRSVQKVEWARGFQENNLCSTDRYLVNGSSSKLTRLQKRGS